MGKSSLLRSRPCPLCIGRKTTKKGYLVCSDCKRKLLYETIKREDPLFREWRRLRYIHIAWGGPDGNIRSTLANIGRFQIEWEARRKRHAQSQGTNL